MPGYIIKHVLPDGSTAGYHADSGCTVTDSRDEAKYGGSDLSRAQEWLKVVRKNFESVWGLETSEHGGGPEYREWSGWKGFRLEDIETVLEEVPVPQRIGMRVIPM